MLSGALPFAFLLRFGSVDSERERAPSTSMMAPGANRRASPVLKVTILENISVPTSRFSNLRGPTAFRSSSTGCCSLRAVALPPFLAVTQLEAPARCFLRTCNHSGDVKRCTMVTEHKSSNRGEIVGSCVEMKTRAPRCRWRRIIESRDSVKVWHSALSVMYLWASSKATTRPISVFCSRNRLKQMLKSEHAVSAVTHGHDKSTIVS